ncbi:hypothetical protein [Microbulbifer thermotolerans]|uniref:hypothetical protein n=1 Tax=Microbulbifer thermotolerans TaxID=252514 RepID=UPI00224AE441|nr:hypothetical protein [Microbulbifer thermotolerans]
MSFSNPLGLQAVAPFPISLSTVVQFLGQYPEPQWIRYLIQMTLTTISFKGVSALLKKLKI